MDGAAQCSGSGGLAPTTVISRPSLSVSSPIRPLRPVRISLLAARRVGEKGTSPRASRTDQEDARHGVPARRSGRWWVVDVPVPVQLGFSVVDAGRDGEGCDSAMGGAELRTLRVW